MIMKEDTQVSVWEPVVVCSRVSLMDEHLGRGSLTQSHSSWEAPKCSRLQREIITVS